MSAYKTVLKEKETLEKTISALSTSTHTSSSNIQLDHSNSVDPSLSTLTSTPLKTSTNSFSVNTNEQNGLAGETSTSSTADVISIKNADAASATFAATNDGSDNNADVTISDQSHIQNEAIVQIPRAELDALHGKISVLAQSIMTMTEEKASVVGKFQNDKKIVADAHRAQVASLREEVCMTVYFLVTVIVCKYACYIHL